MADKHSSSATTLRRIMRLFALMARMDAAWFLRDTRTCLMAICMDLLSNLAAIAGVFLLAWKFDGAAGMTKFEILLMLGYATCVSGVFQLFCCFNNGNISRIIGRGQIDHNLMQPLPLPVQFLTGGFAPVSGSGVLLSGLALVIIAVVQLEVVTSPAWWLLLLFQLITSVALLLAQSYCVSVLAFFAPVNGEEISSVILDLNSTLAVYPLGGLSPAIQWVFVTVLPVGCMAWFPTLGLLQRQPLGLPILWPAVLAILFWYLASKSFKRGLRHYVQYGCNRYRSMGHRS